jgi:O-antigen/teichoic acid export membrane protein
MFDAVERKIKSQFKDENFAEIFRDTSVTFIIRVFGLAAGYLFYFLIARIYGSSILGAFTLSSTVLIMFTVLGRLGIDTSIIKFFAQNAALNKWDTILEVYNKVLRIVIPFGLILSIILYSFSSLISEHVFKKPHLDPYFKVISFAVLPMVLRFINSESYRGFKMNVQYAWSKNVSYYLYASIILGVSSIFYSSSYLPNICFSASLMILGISSTYLIYSKIKSKNSHAGNSISYKELLSTSLPMMLSSSLTLVSGWINTIMLGIFADESQVGVFSVVLKISMVSNFILTSVNSVVAPKFAESHVLKDTQTLKNILKQTAKINFWASIPLFVLILVFRKFILQIFGSDFIIGADLLFFTILGQLINVFSGSVGYLMNMTGYQKEFQRIILFSTLLNIVCCFIFIPWLGMLGSAITNMIFVCSWNLGAVFYIKSKLGLQTFYWPFNYNTPKIHDRVEIAIIGVQKAATTSLLRYLGSHPQIKTHEQMECTYFINDKEYARGYKEFFNTYIDDSDPGKKILIKNVGILLSAKALERLKQHNPMCKIIVMLRNPVDRAYSAFWYAKSKSMEHEENFEGVLHRNELEIKEDYKKRFCSYLTNGQYVNLLNSLYQYFPSDQVQIVLQDDLKSNAADVVKKVCRFIGIDENFTLNDTIIHNISSMPRFAIVTKTIKHGNKIFSPIISLFPKKLRTDIRNKMLQSNSRVFKVPPMSAQTRAFLIDYYKTSNQQLSRLIQRDLSGWNQ